MMNRLTAVVLLATAFSCLPRPSGIDGGLVDAGSVDAGSVDAGARDSGQHDAGQPDAGRDDAGVTDGGDVGNAGLPHVMFERAAGQAFTVVVEHAGITPAHVLQVQLAKGSISAWSQSSSNRIQATITPDITSPTGAYTLTLVTTLGSVTRSPLVLHDVNARWNQPELFASPLNSAGWEDSPQIFTRPADDGGQNLYVAITYFPVRNSCAADAKPSNVACQTVQGPYLPPERPAMTIAPFVNADSGVINHELTHLMGPGAIGPAKLGATLYVFSLAGDGYDGFIGTPQPNPHALNIDGDDGASILTSPFFFERDGGLWVLYNNNRFIDTASLDCHGYPGEVDGGIDTSVDVYVARDIDLSTPRTVLGHYQRVDTGQRFSNGVLNAHSNQLPCPELIKSTNHVEHTLPQGPSGGSADQGNPTVWFSAGGAATVLWDTEGAKLGPVQIATSTSSFPSAVWNSAGAVPTVLSAAGPDEKTQPMISNTELCLRYGLEVQCATFNGTDPRSDSSYGPLIRQLAGTDFVGHWAGQVVAVGEPSRFRAFGRECMGFIVARYQSASSDELDFDIGWVCER